MIIVLCPPSFNDCLLLFNIQYGACYMKHKCPFSWSIWMNLKVFMFNGQSTTVYMDSCLSMSILYRPAGPLRLPALSFEEVL